MRAAGPSRSGRPRSRRQSAGSTAEPPAGRRARRATRRSSRRRTRRGVRRFRNRGARARPGARTTAGRPAREEALALPCANLDEELPAELRVLLEGAAPEGRHGARPLLGDAAHLRAQVGGLEMNGDAERRYQVDEPVGDLLAQPLLHGEATSVEPHEPCELRDAEDLSVGDVGDVRDAVERQRVVLAEREERDRALEDQAAAALRRERGPQLRIAVIAGGRVVERAQKTLRRLPGAGCVRLQPEGGEDLLDVALEALP